MNTFCLFQANAHFQGTIHQEKAWRTNYENTKKSLNEANAKISTLKAKLGSAEADLEEARAKIVVLNDEKENGIDAYKLTPDFVEFMKDHYAERRQKFRRKAGMLQWKPFWRLISKSL